MLRWYCEYCKKYHDGIVLKYTDDGKIYYCARWLYYNREHE